MEKVYKVPFRNNFQPIRKLHSPAPTLGKYAIPVRRAEPDSQLNVRVISAIVSSIADAVDISVPIGKSARVLRASGVLMGDFLVETGKRAWREVKRLCAAAEACATTHYKQTTMVSNQMLLRFLLERELNLGLTGVFEVPINLCLLRSKMQRMGQ